MLGEPCCLEQLIERELEERQQIRPSGVLEQPFVQSFAGRVIDLIDQVRRCRRSAYDLGEFRGIRWSEVIGRAVLFKLLELRLSKKLII